MAHGTLLYSKGIFINRCYDELNLSQLISFVRFTRLPQAGAEMIETNTSDQCLSLASTA